MTVLETLRRALPGDEHTLRQLRVGLEHPEMLASKANQVYTHWRTGCRYNPRGVDVFGQDWDNLVILDACRYDEFARRSDLPGTLESRISRGSTSSEFVRGNFAGKQLYNVAYVSANRWYMTLEEEIDSEIYAFELVERDAANKRTSRPETVSAAAREAVETYPNKRLIVHYMQPHEPYLGPSGPKLAAVSPHKRTVGRSSITHAEHLQAYRENLDLVLSAVESVLPDLPGKTVVTADHGELLGGKQKPIPVRTYDHPGGVYVEELVRVPWHVYESGERKTIVADEPIVATEAYEIEELKESLRDLGYAV